MIRVKLVFSGSSTTICGSVDEVLGFLREFLVEAEKIGLGFKAFFECFKE